MKRTTYQSVTVQVPADWRRQAVYLAALRPAVDNGPMALKRWLKRLGRREITCIDIRELSLCSHLEPAAAGVGSDASTTAAREVA